MSFVTAAPEIVASAASDLASIGSTIGEANAAAAVPTTGVLSAAADEVSAAIASLFRSHAQAFQALSTQAASFHQQFVQLLSSTAAQYASAEAANVSNFGYGNTGTNNIGFFNSGNSNFGIGNTGNYNLGIGNTGSWNFGIGNLSPNNLNPNFNLSNSATITTLGGIGIGNTGVYNVGIGNTGIYNTGLPLPLFVSLLGAGNNGSFNQGLFNLGNFDTGILNWGNNLYGIGLIGDNRFGIGLLSIPYPFPPLPLGLQYPFGIR
jgi:hypothetical protein